MSEPINHEEITHVMSSQGGYGKGVWPNPYATQQKEWERRIIWTSARATLSKKIESLFEPRFITPPETSEFIEALVTMTDSRKVLELGMHTGFTALHILRALLGKEGAKLISVDFRPVHDDEFFRNYSPLFEFIGEKTPQVLKDRRITSVAPFDLIFVDSDHSIEHTSRELDALIPLTTTDTILVFHDLPEWHVPTSTDAHPVRTWILEQVKSGRLRGGILPTCEQLDCLAVFGPGYPKRCNPHLGVFQRGS